MTFPRLGCQTCKIRRIKCDETQPYCRRCIKAQRICYGMKTVQTCPDIHLENAYASGRKKRPRGPRAAQKVELAFTSHTILCPPTFDLNTRALAYYVHYHLQPLKDAKDLSKQVLSVSDHHLPLWMSRVESPILDYAISSMALAVFSRTQHHPPASIEASVRYQRLLQMFQRVVISLNGGNVDKCLIAIFFMSRYEEVIHRSDNQEKGSASALASYSHHDGSRAILQLWKTCFSHSGPASDVVRHTRRGLIRSALLRRIGVPAWMRDGVEFGEHGLDLEYDSILVRLSNLLQRLTMLLKSRNGAGAINGDFMLLLEEARDLDIALQDWTTRFPNSWRYHERTVPYYPIWPPEESPFSLSFSDSSIARIWTQYFAIRMLIISTRLEILEQTDFDYLAPEDYRPSTKCLSDLQKLADLLTASVPSCLQICKGGESRRTSPTNKTVGETMPYMASSVVWPLVIASKIVAVAPAKNKWFRSELWRLGRLTGIGVLECADTA